MPRVHPLSLPVRLALLAVLTASVALLVHADRAHALTARGRIILQARREVTRDVRAVHVHQRVQRTCLRARHRACGRQTRSLRRAEARLARARREVAALRRAPRAIKAVATSTANRTNAPTVWVSGRTVDWHAVSGVSSYVFVRKVPGSPDQYSDVSGTSVTPAAAPGQTVQFSVRTNVTGSRWAPQVAITYPAATSPASSPASAPSPAPAPAPAPSPAPAGGRQIGLVAGSALTYELPFLQQLGARTARLEFSIDTPLSTIEPIVAEYASAGIRPLLLASFDNRLPTVAEAQSLGTWAAALGPGGSYWQGRSEPAGTAVQDIEFGNETSYSYQFTDNSAATYAARAQSYALLVKDAALAIRAANAGVGLLAIADNAQQAPAWVNNMFAAVPDLGQYVAGWTVHPYGPNWASRIDSTISSTDADGGSSSIPVWITEWGLSTDNGRCLDDNYGFNTCLTYDAAASTLQSAYAGMVARYGNRLGGFFLYQAHDQQTTGASTGREGYFGAVQSNGAPKGTYTGAVQALLSSGG